MSATSSTDLGNGAICCTIAALERFPAKWIPVRVKKTRQNKKESLRSDSIGTEKALIDVGKLAQRRAENLAGLADERRPAHHRPCIAKGAGHPDTDRAGAAEQRIGIRT